MASLPLSELLIATREEIVAFSTDLIFRDGDSADSRNSESPVASVSITRQINKAILDILIATKFNIVIDTTVSSVISQQEYAVPVGWIELLSLSFGSRRLLKTNVVDLDARLPNWRSATAGTPLKFYANGSTKFGVYPAPSSAAAFSALVVKEITALSVLTDTLASFPAIYNYLIVTRAAWHCAKLDAANPNASARAEILDNYYKENLAALKAYISDRMGIDNDAPKELGQPSGEASS